MAILSLFRCVAQSKILTTSVCTLTLACTFMTLIFSMEQYGNKAEFPCGSGCDWTKDICDSEIITFLSPFKFDVKNLTLHGKNQCGWSHTNSLFRILVCAMIILCSMLSILFIMCLNVYNGLHKIEWNVLKILYFLLSILVFSVLVLDCQSLHSGYESCKSNFDINNRKIIVAGWNVENCYLNPYAYTIYFDAGTVVLCAFSFILHQLIPPSKDAYYKKDDNYMSINSVKEETKKSKDVSAYNTSSDNAVSAYNTSFDHTSVYNTSDDKETEYKTNEDDVTCNNPTDTDFGALPAADDSYSGAYN